MFSSGFALSILLLGEENKILSLLPSFLYAGMCHIYIYIYVIHIYIYDSCKNLCKNSTDDFIPYYISVICFFSKSILLSSIRIHMKNNWNFNLSYKYVAAT